MHSTLFSSSNPPLPRLTPVRPMLMMTGFLGAGKTTLLRTLLDDLSRLGHPADVILNDCENALLDQETLRGHAAGIDALTGTCVCCEGLDELCGMILRASKSQHKVLLIELNGTADPLPLQETFTLLELKFLLRPRWQVCVIDARHFGKRRQFRELEKLQLETASQYYLSHTRDLTAEELTSLEKEIKEVNSLASPATSTDLSQALSQAIEKNNRHALRTGEATSQKTPSHLHSRHHVAHEFTGCNLIFPKIVKTSRIIPWLESLPASVVRAKALLALSTDPNRRHLYERVAMEVSPHPIAVRSIDRIPCSGLFIGPQIDPAEILHLTQKHLHSACHFPE
ncbi:MAG: GTP-binding protein [Akkermansiaceae bacterium]